MRPENEDGDELPTWRDFGYAMTVFIIALEVAGIVGWLGAKLYLALGGD